MHPPPSKRIAILGGGPAGLMAAECAVAAGAEVHLYDAKGSVGRKFLLAGKGGLNLTHSEPKPDFIARYGERADVVGRWLAAFDADALRDWARGLGVETFVGSSGRVFPSDLKAAPLLRGWVRRLRAQDVHFHLHHRWLGWSDDGALRFATAEGERTVRAAATVLALGGASWPELGSDGAWVEPLSARGVALAPLVPANCGFEIAWSAHLVERHAGAPVKPVRIAFTDADDRPQQRQGELVVSRYGIEGSLVYAYSSALRRLIAARGSAAITLDLAPGRRVEELAAALARPRGSRSRGEHLRRTTGLDAVKLALIHEVVDRALLDDPAALAAAIKALPLTLTAPRPIAEAISTAGGVRFEALTDELMLREHPGVFVAGEMLDWEAPTGGYLLTACFASGKIAGEAAAHFVGAAQAAM